MKRSNEWLLRQLLTLGSTAAGVAANASPYQTPAGLYDAMMLAADGRITEKDFTDDMRRGLMTEPLHRQLLADELSKNVHEHDQEEFIYNADYPWAHALPDGWIYEIVAEKSALKIPVQLKCPRIRGWYDIRLKGIHGHWLLGSQHTLAVTGAPYEYFSVLNVESMRLIHFQVERDEKLIESLMDIEKRFYQGFLDQVRPFELEQQLIDLPEPSGELVTLNNEEARRAAMTYIAANDYLNEAAMLRDEAKAKIKTLMGDARVADLPGLRCYHSKNDGRSKLDLEAMERDGININKYEKQGNPYYIFNAYPRKAG